MDQGVGALFNFSFVFATSLLLSTEEFAFANYGFLAIFFVVNVSNALIFQPYLWTTSKSHLANVRSTTLYAALASAIVSLVASPLLYAVCKNLGMPGETIYLTILVMCASIVYELGRRVNMLYNRWVLNLLYGTSLIALVFLAVFIMRPNTALGMLAVVLAGYTVLGVPILLFGLVAALRSPIPSDGVGASSDMYWTSLRYGVLLLGGAIAFWFISGGYLLIIAKLVSTYDVTVLRVTQNFMNGILLIFAALDNRILAGQAYNLIQRPSSVYGSLVLIVILYSVLAYVAFVLIYPSMRSSVYLIVIWMVVYLLTTFTRLWISIFKWYGDARSVLTVQVGGMIFFVLLVGLAALLDLQLGATEVTLFWLLSSLVIYMLVLVSRRKIVFRDGRLSS